MGDVEEVPAFGDLAAEGGHGLVVVVVFGLELLAGGGGVVVGSGGGAEDHAMRLRRATDSGSVPDVNDTLIAAGVALVTGGIASLVAPWAQWGVEKRRETRTHRRALLEEWRTGIADLGGSAVALGGSDEAYRDTVWYGSLEQYLSPEVLEKLLDTNVQLLVRRPSGGVRFGTVADELRAEVARIQKDWGLG